MVVDTSVLIAILTREPDGPELATVIVDAGLVLGARGGLAAVNDRHRFIAAAAIVVEPFTAEHAHLALAASARFGKGRGHPAGLNFGDVCAYALAVATGESLLFKGNDFVHTDIPRAPVL